MASRAALRWINLPIMNEASSGFFILFGFGSLPIKIINLLDWSYVFFWVSVTFQTKSHTQWHGMLDNFHLINSTMALYAANSPINMHRVIKINIIWSLVDTHPRYGIS